MELQQIIQILVGAVIPWLIKAIKAGFPEMGNKPAQWIVFGLGILVTATGMIIKGGFDWSDPLILMSVLATSELSYRQIWKDYWNK